MTDKLNKIKENDQIHPACDSLQKVKADFDLI